MDILNNTEGSAQKDRDVTVLKSLRKDLENELRSPSNNSNSPYKPIAKYSHKDDVK